MYFWNIVGRFEMLVVIVKFTAFIKRDISRFIIIIINNAYPAAPQGILIKGGSPDTKAAKTVQGLMEPHFPKQMSNFHS